MRRSGTCNPVIRVVLALLALVAAVAYQFRATPTGSHVQMTGPHMAQAPHSHHYPAAHTGTEHPAGAGHAAHCLFCVTGAFGVAVALPAAFRRGQEKAGQPDDLTAPLTFERTWTALARAPPAAA